MKILSTIFANWKFHQLEKIPTEGSLQSHWKDPYQVLLTNCGTANHKEQTLGFIWYTKSWLTGKSSARWLEEKSSQELKEIAFDETTFPQISRPGLFEVHSRFLIRWLHLENKWALNKKYLRALPSTTALLKYDLKRSMHFPFDKEYYT